MHLTELGFLIRPAQESQPWSDRRIVGHVVYLVDPNEGTVVMMVAKYQCSV